MTLILNSPETFAAESLAGFVAANGTRVRPAPGGVVRSTVRAPGKVAVVVGGGSGHYPAFAGVVGEGLADGAVCGDVFASPTSDETGSGRTLRPPPPATAGDAGQGSGSCERESRRGSISAAFTACMRKRP